ncbi:FtsX-like permease family protein [Actinoplanes awajinensis]|uniref:ABC transporter permease n=1 Tax=Actinoplanes awajinensis subsp. mycoplanecinus TaxID=135947 RepID=A0A101J7P0_9ACTN|nr:FtsX-like permease family protein [Actinoplanes awajinensis]KUL21724.1 ABC transporter permease [Actinoplanes awajinensis subsp. mycoplanecinus]
MIGLGLRLAVSGGREAIVRLAVLAAAVAVGTGMLLVTLAGVNAVHAQNLRYSWLNSGVTSAATGPEAADPALWQIREDFFRGDPIARVDVAISGPDGPVLPGRTALPAPGEYVVSPALDRLLRTHPADQLRDRFPGRQTGVLGHDALPSPDSLIAVVGGTREQVSRIPGATEVTRMVTVSPDDCRDCRAGIGADGIVLTLSVVAAALLFPLLIFIGTATRLSAARREQRFAAMRLIGATPRQITQFAAAESAAAAAAGALAGLAVFFAARVGLARVPFTGDPFFLDDLSLSLLDWLVVTLGVPLAAALAARIALRRVRISPLGVARRVTPRPPRAWRVLPLLLALAELGYLVGHRPLTRNGQVLGYLGGIFGVMIGLMIAGSWLTMAGSRLLARRAQRPATLIAGRRLADNPRAGFRAVSGLMLALFVTSTATGVITTIVAERSGSPGAAGHDLVSVLMLPEFEGTPPGEIRLPSGLPAHLIRVNPDGGPETQHLPGLITCADLATIPDAGACPPGAQVAEVWPGLSGNPAEDPAWPASTWTPAQLATLKVINVVVPTDGTPAAIEHARTVLNTTFPYGRLPATDADYRHDWTRQLPQFQRLADVAIISSLVIAGCSLAVSVTGGLTERRRPFAMLRLTGVRLSELRRVVVLESAVPLLAVSVVAVGTGFLAAHFFLRSQMEYELHPPGTSYYVIVVAGLLAAIGVIASTMPLLNRMTGPAAARNE